MSTIWGTVRDRLRRSLTDAIRQDEDGNDITPAFSNTELADYWNAAQQELVIYDALEAVVTYPVGSESEVLPADFYQVKWVRYDITDGNHLLELYDPLAYERDPHDSPQTGLYYLMRNDTTILFTEATEYVVTLCYATYYPIVTDPDDDDAVISVPTWAVQPLEYFAIAKALERRMIEDADLRRWAARTMDAGLPTSNPYPPIARWYLDRSREEMNKHRR